MLVAAAFYCDVARSQVSEDTLEIQEDDLVKIDMGVHVDGELGHTQLCPNHHSQQGTSPRLALPGGIAASQATSRWWRTL